MTEEQYFTFTKYQSEYFDTLSGKTVDLFKSLKAEKKVYYFIEALIAEAKMEVLDNMQKDVSHWITCNINGEITKEQVFSYIEYRKAKLTQDKENAK